ncbi:MAG: MarR family transcriptional regulator [Acidimicrobiales bacterium]
MPAATTVPVSALASDVRIAVTRLSRRLRRERAVGTLTPSQLSVLTTLDTHGPLTPSALADHERVQPPSMTRILGRLEELGLVSRTADPADKRQYIVALTAQGVATVTDERRRKDAWLAKRIADLSEEERAAIAAALPVIERIAGG